MLSAWFSQRKSSSRGRTEVRLGVEVLERREVPAVAASALPGTFFLDRNNGLIAATGAPGGVVNTGGFGISLSVGKDLAGLPMAVIRDANSRVYIYDQGTWIDTGGYARELVAGRNGTFFARDFNNTVHRYQLGAGWAMAASPGTGDLRQHQAVQLSIGEERVTNPSTGATFITSVLYTRTPSNQVEVFREAGSFGATSQSFVATFINTGGFATDIAAGYQGEAFIRDGNNRLYVYNGSWSATGAWAMSLDVGVAGDNSYLVFKDGNSQIYIFQPGSQSFIATGGYARQVAASANDLYIRDFNNTVHYFDIGSRTWTNLHRSASLIRAAGFATTSVSASSEGLGHVWGISAEPNNSGQVFFFDGAWTSLGFPAKEVQGYRGR
jgi:hypothetical protein